MTKTGELMGGERAICDDRDDITINAYPYSNLYIL